MVTTTASTNQCQSYLRDTSLETFSLVWLEYNESTNDHHNTEQELRAIINHLKKIQNVQECKKYIEGRPKIERIIVVASDQMAQEIVPSIHNFRHVIAIYVHCVDKKLNEEWTSKFAKVKSVLTRTTELIDSIKTDQRIYQSIDEPLSFNVYNTGLSEGKSTTTVNGEFIFSQVLIDCLLRLKSDETDRKELIDQLNKQYEGNNFQMKLIDEFQKSYSPNKVLWWYTRESFFYKTLNAVLRHQNIDWIFLFREFIVDINCQLKRLQTPNAIDVYRGQLMSLDELKILQECCGQLISINSFFSTTTSKQLALFYITSCPTTGDVVPVLFKINASPRINSKTSFADIRTQSEFPNELEILFMLGSIFRFDSVERSSDSQVWIIRMTLCSDDELGLKHVLMSMKEQLGDGETNLRKLGNLLSEMGRFDLAEKYLTRSLQKLIFNDSTYYKVCNDLGKVASQAGDLEKSMLWRQKALELKNEITSYSRFVSYVSPSARWERNGVTVAGSYGKNGATTQLRRPYGLFLDGETMVIADYWNHRIIQWNKNDTNGQIVAGGNGQGHRLNQLYCPTDVLVDKETDNLIIANYRRVVRWSRHNNTKHGEILIDKIYCCGLAMDDERSLYVSDYVKHQVKRYRLGDKLGTVVAGGNGKGNRLNQLNSPAYLFVDQQQNVYVSDNKNHRIMKWNKGAKEGIVVAGGNGEGNSLAQLKYPNGIFVDSLKNLYVADSGNNRIMLWCQGDKEGTIVVGGNGEGVRANQFWHPGDLSFDPYGNLYVTDCENHRVQRFDITR